MKIPTIFPHININTENSRTQLPSVNDGNDLTSSGAAPGGGGPLSLESEHHRTRDVDPDTAQPVQPKPGAEEQSARETIEAKEARKAGGNGEDQPSRNGLRTALSQEQLESIYGMTLVGDIKDAELLLSYATRNGLQDDKRLTKELVQQLVTVREKFNNGKFDPQTEEASFRANYGVLAEVIAPVTVSSLRDSLPTLQRRHWCFLLDEPERRSFAERACFRYRNGAFIVLSALLLCQVYLAVISSLLGKLQIPSIAFESPTKPASQVVEAATKKDAQPSEILTSVQNSRIQMLASWMPKSDETKARIKGYLDKHAGKEEINLAAPDSPFIAVCVRAEQYAAVLVAWWLPLLYGALGSMVFVVRCLSLQAQDRLFRKERLVALNMRIYLGMIAGLAIGWFWKDSTQTGITTLAPFALAFVAGYGVELFFALLDKIVTTFAKGPE